MYFACQKITNDPYVGGSRKYGKITNGVCSKYIAPFEAFFPYCCRTSRSASVIYPDYLDA